MLKTHKSKNRPINAWLFLLLFVGSTLTACGGGGGGGGSTGGGSSSVSPQLLGYVISAVGGTPGTVYSNAVYTNGTVKTVSTANGGQAIQNMALANIFGPIRDSPSTRGEYGRYFG